MRALLLLAVTLSLAFSAPAQSPKKFVLIGGKATPAARNFLPLLGGQMRATPTFAGSEIWLYPTGWPEDPKALEGTAALLLYAEKLDESEVPAAALQTITSMQEQGTGVVALRASFPGARPFQSVYAEARGELKSATAGHALMRGIAPFVYAGSLNALSGGEPAVPILKDASEHCFAWAAEDRAGLLFQFTGGARAEELEAPSIRKLVLNALAWGAGLEVPAHGVETTDPVIGAAVVTKPAENEVIPQEWGSLSWYTSAKLKNTRTLTSGLAVLKPGQTNPRHFHPNCDEVLHVLQGKIRHSMNDKTAEMSAGDTVSIPSGVVHNAANIGAEDAILAISFSSAYRVVIGEK
jgi:quercetin dioxygenase-like cupin family protein